MLFYTFTMVLIFFLLIMKNKFHVFLCIVFTNYSVSQIAFTQYGSDVFEASAPDSNMVPVISGDGNTVAIGRPLTPNGTGFGSVKIFNYNSGNWVQSGNDILGETWGEEFGSAMAISDDGLTIAIGAFKRTTELGWGTGYVKVYNFVSGNWVQKGQSIFGPNTNSQLGRKILLSANGDTIVLRGQTTSNATQYLKIFNFSSGTWNLSHTLQHGQGGIILNYYSEIDLSSNGTRLAINSTIWDLISNEWVRTDNNFYISNISIGSISLSGDGNTIAIGNAYSFFIYKNLGGSNWQYSYGENFPGYNNNKSVDTNFNGNIITVYDHNSLTMKAYRFSNYLWTYFGYISTNNGANRLSSNGDKILSNFSINSNNPYNNIQTVKVYDTAYLLGISEFIPFNFSVFPNPARNIIFIHFDDDTQLEKLNLFNLQGQKLMESNINSLDISSFSKGCYLLEVTTNKGKAVKRVIFE